MQLSTEKQFMEAFHSNKKVEGYTHKFYRYPARFNPDFIRQVILEFSEPGDVVLDPFMGGGTTIVETLATGRLAIGLDINELAQFITTVKTTPLSRRDIREIKEWSRSFRENPGLFISESEIELDPRTKNLPEDVRRFLATALWAMSSIRFPRQRRFVRCALLRVGQWAVESNRNLPTAAEMMRKLYQEIDLMLEGLNEFVEAAGKAGVCKGKITKCRTLLHRSASDPAIHEAMLRYGRRPKLLITSPPYPGVHVLYHRWQVLGRRETPAPYWIADLNDGFGASYYTMSCRSPFGFRKYFVRLRQAFENLKVGLSPETTVIQLVAFSRTEEQLPLYQEAMATAGYEELHFPYMITDDKLIRIVPNRKWYAYKQDRNDASHEVLMIHRVRY